MKAVRFLEDYLSRMRPGKLRAFRKLYARLENLAALRESPKYYWILGVNHLRRRAIALADQWVKEGRLDSSDQVFYLKLDDLVRAESGSDLDIRAIAEDNRAYYTQFNPHNDPPVLIDSRGYIPRLPPRSHKENELVGTPVSSGTVKGPVNLLTRPDEKPIRPGDILVTKATDPGWTTLFINAAGVLLESGGALQHGASVAREMGKPCIVGIEKVTRILEDGQTVTFDGAVGVVTILD
ncbi:MAG: hypothetical protein KOO61_03515 [Spirochaetales bacterium]|nr:hypothetical protein [Spirochaetales bacterium]